MLPHLPNISNSTRNSNTPLKNNNQGTQGLQVETLNKSLKNKPISQGGSSFQLENGDRTPNSKPKIKEQTLSVS